MNENVKHIVKKSSDEIAKKLEDVGYTCVVNENADQMEVKCHVNTSGKTSPHVVETVHVKLPFAEDSVRITKNINKSVLSLPYRKDLRDIFEIDPRFADFIPRYENIKSTMSHTWDRENIKYFGYTEHSGFDISVFSRIGELISWAEKMEDFDELTQLRDKETIVRKKAPELIETLIDKGFLSKKI